MTHRPSWFLRRWHHLGVGVMPVLPFALWACTSQNRPVKEPATNPAQVTDLSDLANAERAVDILFMVDNSPSMDPKQAALALSFFRMIQQLQQLPGGLPDIHIGVISSDVGDGSEGGGCDVPLGDRGLLWGNDPTPGVRATVASSSWVSPAGCGLNSGARWIEDVQNPDGISRQKNYTGDLSDVFSCLAKAVGVNGCGYEHQLQSHPVRPAGPGYLHHGALPGDSPSGVQGSCFGAPL
jgi:hypothetical protein